MELYKCTINTCTIGCGVKELQLPDKHKKFTFSTKAIYWEISGTGPLLHWAQTCYIEHVTLHRHTLLHWEKYVSSESSNKMCVIVGKMPVGCGYGGYKYCWSYCRPPSCSTFPPCSTCPHFHWFMNLLLQSWVYISLCLYTNYIQSLQ